MDKQTLLRWLISLGLWCLIGLYIYALVQVWNAMVTSTAIFAGIAHTILFIIMIIIGIPLLPALLILGLIIIAE